MTDPLPDATPTRKLRRQLVLASLVMVARAVAYTDVRCPACGWWVMAIPGELKGYRVRLAATGRDGTGRIVRCKHCGELEVTEL